MEQSKIITSLRTRIENMRKKRLEFIKKYDNSYDSKTNKYSMEEPKEIDELGKIIYKMLCDHQGLLTIDFIIEELTHLGQAPSIVYNDHGYFAVTGDGVQNVVFEPSDITITHFVEKDMWKPTIREALEYYLKGE